VVRVNLIKPFNLADQHLIAEYAEILMLMAYIRAHPGEDDVREDDIPVRSTMGKGHMRFFKDKALYLKKRHEELKKEMRKRGFVPKRSLSLAGMKKSLLNDWKPNPQDLQIIKKRLIQKLKMEPEWYRYYGEHRPKKFLIRLVSESE